MSNIYPETCENCKRFRMCDASALCHECQAEIQLESAVIRADCEDRCPCMTILTNKAESISR